MSADSKIDSATEAEEQGGDLEGSPKAACIGPGACLCEAREELGLNRAKVGQQLGLTETAVKDLEKNHFDRFPSSVYVRGYLKNYAKVLGKSETEVIEIYDRFCLENGLDSGKSIMDPAPENTASSHLTKIIIGLLIVGIIAALVTFFMNPA